MKRYYYWLFILYIFIFFILILAEIIKRYFEIDLDFLIDHAAASLNTVDPSLSKTVFSMDDNTNEAAARAAHEAAEASRAKEASLYRWWVSLAVEEDELKEKLGEISNRDVPPSRKRIFMCLFVGCFAVLLGAAAVQLNTEIPGMATLACVTGVLGILSLGTVIEEIPEDTTNDENFEERKELFDKQRLEQDTQDWKDQMDTDRRNARSK